MNSDVVVLAFGAALYGAWALEKRRRAVSLKWPAGLIPVQIAKRCQDYFKIHGITSYILDGKITHGPRQGDADFNMRIPNEQFDRRIGVFKLLCRDNIYVVGELFFRDASSRLRAGNDRIATLVLILPRPPDTYQQAWARMWDVAIIHTGQLKEFVEALKRAKAGEPIDYRGDSEVLKTAFSPRVDQEARARGREDVARDAERRGDWATAEKQWADCFEQHPERWHYLISLARARSAQGRVEEAGATLYEAWARFPFEPEVALHAANHAQATGDIDEAFRICKEVMLRFPNNWLGYRAQIATLSRSGRQAEADEMLQAHAPAFPNELSAIFELAQLAERKRDWAQAADRWRSYLALNERESWIHLRLYRALTALGATGEAEDALRYATSLFPDDPNLAKEQAGRAESLS